MCLRSWNCQQNWYVNTKCGYNQADTLLSVAPCGFHQLSEKSLFKKKKTNHACQWGFEICNNNVCWHREGRDPQWGRYAASITGIPVLPSSRLCGFGTCVWENNVIPKVGSILGWWCRLLWLGGAGSSVCLHCFPHTWMHRDCSSLLPPEHRFSQCQTAALSSSETVCNEYPFPALSPCFISHS